MKLLSEEEKDLLKKIKFYDIIILNYTYICVLIQINETTPGTYLDSLILMAIKRLLYFCDDPMTDMLLLQPGFVSYVDRLPQKSLVGGSPFGLKTIASLFALLLYISTITQAVLLISKTQQRKEVQDFLNDRFGYLSLYPNENGIGLANSLMFLGNKQTVEDTKAVVNKNYYSTKIKDIYDELIKKNSLTESNFSQGLPINMEVPLDIVKHTRFVTTPLLESEIKKFVSKTETTLGRKLHENESLVINAIRKGHVTHAFIIIVTTENVRFIDPAFFDEYSLMLETYIDDSMFTKTSTTMKLGKFNVGIIPSTHMSISDAFGKFLSATSEYAANTEVALIDNDMYVIEDRNISEMAHMYKEEVRIMISQATELVKELNGMPLNELLHLKDKFTDDSLEAFFFKMAKDLYQKEEQKLKDNFEQDRKIKRISYLNAESERQLRHEELKKYQDEYREEKQLKMNTLVFLTVVAFTMRVSFITFKKIMTRYYRKITDDNIHEMVDKYFEDETADDIGNWDVSNVTNMEELFSGRKFNKNLNWDVSNVTNMAGMFLECTRFNGKLTYNGHPWNVSNVTNTRKMFHGCLAFNQPLEWDVAKVTNMEGMFTDCCSFNQPLEWDVSNVTNMNTMFSSCTSFNGPLTWKGGNWDVGSAITMESMFSDCTLFDQPLEWDVSNVINMSRMFETCMEFRGPLTWKGGDWNVSKVRYMDLMFYLCILFTQNLSNWDVRSVRYHVGAFDHCPCPQPRFLDRAGLVAFEGTGITPQKKILKMQASRANG